MNMTDPSTPLQALAKTLRRVQEFCNSCWTSSLVWPGSDRYAPTSPSPLIWVIRAWRRTQLDNAYRGSLTALVRVQRGAEGPPSACDCSRRLESR